MPNIYDELRKITHWHEYMPMDTQYYQYKNNVIFAACKISDLYYQICNARKSLHFYMDFDTYSMMSDSDEAIRDTKKYFVENALLYYNFSVDYLWQMLWLYYDNSDGINKIATNERYQSVMRECNLNDLIRGLVEIKENKIAEVLKDYFTDRNKEYKQIREYYNYLKHRAIFHTPDLGINDNVSMMPVPAFVSKKKDMYELVSFKIPMISRTELDMEELKNLLVEFDKQFVDICEYFIQIIMPRDFTNSRSVKYSIIERYTKHHLDELMKYSNIHPEIVSRTECEIFFE